MQDKRNNDRKQANTKSLSFFLASFSLVKIYQLSWLLTLLRNFFLVFFLFGQNRSPVVCCA